MQYSAIINREMTAAGYRLPVARTLENISAFRKMRSNVKLQVGYEKERTCSKTASNSKDTYLQSFPENGQRCRCYPEHLQTTRRG